MVASLDRDGPFGSVSGVRDTPVDDLGVFSDISLGDEGCSTGDVEVFGLDRISFSPRPTMKYSPSGRGAISEGALFSEAFLVPSRSLETDVVGKPSSEPTPKPTEPSLAFESPLELSGGKSFGLGTWSSIIFPSSPLSSGHSNFGQH